MIKVIQFKPNNNLICYGVHKIDDLTNVILPRGMTNAIQQGL